jgi:hypothetical protein
LNYLLVFRRITKDQEALDQCKKAIVRSSTKPKNMVDIQERVISKIEGDLEKFFRIFARSDKMVSLNSQEVSYGTLWWNMRYRT